MATTADIRSGLATNIAAGFTGWNVQAYMPSALPLPCIYVLPAGITFDSAMGRSSDTLKFIVRACVAYTSDIGAQEALDATAAPSGANSVKAAVESDKTLGGVVAWCRVTDASEPRLVDHGATGPTICIDFGVEVMT